MGSQHSIESAEQFTMAKRDYLEHAKHHPEIRRNEPWYFRFPGGLSTPPPVVPTKYPGIESETDAAERWNIYNNRLSLVHSKIYDKQTPHYDCWLSRFLFSISVNPSLNVVQKFTEHGVVSNRRRGVVWDLDGYRQCLDRRPRRSHTGRRSATRDPGADISRTEDVFRYWHQSCHGLSWCCNSTDYQHSRCDGCPARVLRPHHQGDLSNASERLHGAGQCLR